MTRLGLIGLSLMLAVVVLKLAIVGPNAPQARDAGQLVTAQDIYNAGGKCDLVTSATYLKQFDSWRVDCRDGHSYNYYQIKHLQRWYVSAPITPRS